MAQGVYIDNAKIKNIYVDNTRVRRVYIDNSQVYNARTFWDWGLNMNSCKLVLGNGTHNPISGGSGNDWSINFSFVWKSAKGGVLLYHNWNSRESMIKLHNDGRIQVWAARYETGSDRSWYSTLRCEVGKLNRVLVTRQGRIYINGEDATPSSYGGDMPLWGEVNIFPDRDIDGVCLGINAWNWNLQYEHRWVTNLDYGHESDASTFAIGFNQNMTFRLNGLSGALKSTTGTPAYTCYDVYWDWVAKQSV